MDYRKTAIAAVSVVTCFMISAVTAVVALGRDPAQIVYLLGAITASVIPAVLTLAATESIKNRVDSTDEKVATVQKQTNGNFTALLEHNTALRAIIEKAGLNVDSLEASPAPDTHTGTDGQTT